MHVRYVQGWKDKKPLSIFTAKEYTTSLLHNSELNQDFLTQATKEGLGNLGAGSSCLKEAKETSDKQEAEPIAQHTRIGSAGKPEGLRQFDREWAFAADLLAAKKLLVEVLTLRKDETSLDWDA
jgi:hypothetical protein